MNLMEFLNVFINFICNIIKFNIITNYFIFFYITILGTDENKIESINLENTLWANTVLAAGGKI